ncbi:MAG: tRNA uridine-5-carboxymethylaminomethyl(34) synthesis enzyme MnmG [Phycisphaerales bacterium]|nr:tRNA uridine-5-carboxymethylaminomethyl(34) synthesis enzyme MnmG [Phycisphaerales bacterium]
MPNRFDVIVVGGGHAGVEAAWAAANRLGTPASVALVTLDPGSVGVMSCNPAIGGLAKGQLAREVDALGGLMGLATDATGIQFRVLNTSKGAAVHGPRAQCDKLAYARCIRQLIASRPEIQVIAGSVEQLLVEGGEIRGVVIAPLTRATGQWPEGRGPRPILTDVPLTLHAGAVVLTTGTFMRGLMHTGTSQTPGGRHGEAPALGISGALADLGFELGRLKTGTPPRLARDSIDWETLTPQHGDDPAQPFSDLTLSGEAVDEAAPSLVRFPALPQVCCHQTNTTPEMHELIRANLDRAPMFSGQITSSGPRYCPSIEDKVVRFAERETHGVFLEPESHESDWIYCNGISTSLPADVQERLVRMMPGCSRAVILRPGYAVEYDMVRPHQIRATGMTRLVRGLFLAGQINGTSGYEEAAAQGIIAGINAALLVSGGDELVLGREEAYIGVLMDDLVTKTPVEPYRMFTSRAEHRLLLRADNSADRLTPIAQRLGLLSTTPLGRLRERRYVQRQQQLHDIGAALDVPRGVGADARAGRLTLAQMREAMHAHEPLRTLRDDVWLTAHAERSYEAYIIRQRAEVKRLAGYEHKPIPDSIDYHALESLRTEARHALAKFRPATLGQAGRLEGVTPADLTLLAVLAKRWEGPRATQGVTA